jgi:transposase
MSKHIAQRMAARVARARGVGLSRGGQTTKIYVLTDVLGRPGVLLLTPGNASDVTTAPAVLAEAPGRSRRLAPDESYGSTRGEAVITPIVPGKRYRSRRIHHDKCRYRERWRIKATFNCLKDFHRIATRYDKLARNYASAVTFAPFRADRVQTLFHHPALLLPIIRNVIEKRASVTQ